MRESSSIRQGEGGGDGTIRYRDRATGEQIAESTFGHDTLRFLYVHPRGRLLTDHLLSRRVSSRLYGLIQRSSRTRHKIPRFAESLGIDVSEAEHPLGSYRSLDDFFTRRLIPGARPIDPDPATLVSPADGRVLVMPRLGAGTLRVKGGRVSLEQLVGDPDLAARYVGGVGFIVRLAFSDYHRFHFPDGGIASPSAALGRRLHSVHTIALTAGAPSFENRRAVSRLDSDGFGCLLLVDVGALFVGTIVQTYRPGRVERGDEKGYFRFGGSTVVLLVEPGRVEVDPDLVAWSTFDAPGAIETHVRMGTPIARRTDAPARG